MEKKKSETEKSNVTITQRNTKEEKKIRNKIEKENGLIILEFEIVTAIAFYWFAAEKCDIVCLEVGIGGLMDSTNIIKTSNNNILIFLLQY